MAELAIREMTHLEAKECVVKINSGLTNVRTLLLELYERRGWDALGYPSWEKCVTGEFDQHRSYMFRQLAAAKAEVNLSPMGDKSSVGNIPERHLRPLTPLAPDEQAEAWDRANETAPASGLTASHVEETVKKMKAEKTDPPPIEPQREPPRDSRPASMRGQKSNGVTAHFKGAWEEMFRAIRAAKEVDWQTMSKDSVRQYLKALTDFVGE